ncbi:hypothetical protein KUL17_24810 [Alteromonas sp. KUL17]|uniref:DUF349 domain-containing protein n=1 Tax=Alteromonas sp. KUL17 TaxID=2480796 RepID=UPI001037EFE7|nr:DUF349 domain-containing protein [Alteromonas sp. KUL17]TAP25545.1 DUF349 domain-containing protein [Alteromonas sp. KUL17]GEA03584.1 hypothetical protein KUL17_24810 [Alteromonas sp. KUL17]
MIFSRIFAPSHQSPKPEKRMQAIESLSPDKAQEKTILHELAFNDEDANVSLAALEKLNSFVLWLKMSQIAKQSRVKKAAEKKVNAALLGEGDVTLSRQEIFSFLTETANADLVVQLVPQMLKKEPMLLQDDALANALIEKVAKPSFTQFVFLEGASPQLQTQLINAHSDVSDLQKLAKKVSDDALTKQINARIDAIKEAAKRPVELKKQLTLGLSKYQALLDKSDVETIDEKRSELESELTGLFAQIDLLTSEERADYEEKRARIGEQLERYLSRIRPAWEEKQQASQRANTKALCEQQLTYAKEQVAWLYNNRLCEATLADVATVNESVRGVEATLEQLARLDDESATDKRITQIKRSVDELNEQLDRFSMQQQYGQKLLIKLQSLEDIAAKIVSASDSESGKDTRDVSVEEASASTENLSQVNGGDALQSSSVVALKAEFDEARQAYKVLSREIDAIPKALSKRFNAATSSVNAKERAQKSKENEQVKHIRKHISVIDNLIAQGKFRVAISKFAKLQESYAALPGSAKKYVEKRFEKTAGDVSRLEGWQDYLAAPRKPALLEEAKALASADAENIKQRSKAIKYLRKQWLSLTPSSSTSEESSDDALLQQQFDDALEKAFEPCRAHYAKLDAQRAAAREKRESIIATVKAMDINMPEAELVKVFDRVSKQWHAAGQVEREIYEQLKQEWKEVSSPIQAKVNKWQSDNQAQKRALVTQACQLATEEDVAGAADKAQQLQSQWKQIGHAGKREESKLWAEFKAANDTVFERLKAERKVQNNAFNALVDSLLKQVEAVDINSDDATFSQSISDVRAQFTDLPKAQRTKVDKKIDSLESKRAAQAKNAQSQARLARAQALISLLQLSVGEGSGDEQSLAETLGKRWSSVLGQSTGNKTTQHDRQWLTVALEVATGMPSPDADASICSSVQLQMMTSKLEQGEAATAPDILADWLSYDSIREADNHLLQRVVAVIDAHPEIVV